MRPVASRIAASRIAVCLAAGAALLLAIHLAPPAAAQAAKDCIPDGEQGVTTPVGCLILKTHRGAGPHDTLAVLLHGDVSSGGPADYLFAEAEGIAKRHAHVIAVALVRPGYGDSAGRRSAGNDMGRRDHYTQQYIDAAAAGIAALKQHHKASRVVVIGHSGGAAYTGVMIGRQPGLVDVAVLAACPCDLIAWRTYSGGRPWGNSWSPSDLVGKVAASSVVFAATGDADRNTHPQLAADYVAKLTARGIRAEFQAAPGASHNAVVGSATLNTMIDRALAR